MKVLTIDKSRLLKRDSAKVKHITIVGLIGTLIDQHYKPAKYCDAVNTYVFKFNRNIKEDEFIMWLENNGHRVREKKEWYMDYSRIRGAGNKWTYEWVSPYTD